MARGEHVQVLDDLLLLLLATTLRRRTLETKRKHANPVAHRGNADDQHQQILGITALGAEDNRAQVNRRQVHDQEGSGIFGQHDQTQHPCRRVQAPMPPHAGALGLVLLTQEAVPRIQQNPIHIELANGPEPETLRIAIGKNHQRGNAGDRENRRRHREHAPARFVQIVAKQNPKRRDEPASGQHRGKRTDEEISGGERISA